MTVGTLALLTITGSLVLLKVGLMAVAVALLAKTLLPASKPLASRPEPASLPSRSDASR